MDTRRCAHKWHCEQLAKNCSMVYHFSHTISIFSGKILFQSRQQSNLYHLLEGLTRDICYGFQDTLFQAHKTDILEVSLRCFSFRQPERLFKKLLSVPPQYLCGEYNRKTGLTAAHNFKSSR